jgi:hypothetical protein
VRSCAARCFSVRAAIPCRPRRGARPWLIVGDFNIARFTEDRNNKNFDARAADDLNALIDALELQELPLLDRRFTWSNRRANPTLVWLDRALINLPWGERLFNTSLVSLLRNTSDHVPSRPREPDLPVRALVGILGRLPRLYCRGVGSPSEPWARVCSRTPMTFSQMG